MAIGRISGPMLFKNLERQGQDLAIDGNLIYFDVTQRRVGINTLAPTVELDILGSANITGNLWVTGNATVSSIPEDQIVFTAENGLLSFDANLRYDHPTETLYVTNANVSSNLEVGGNATISSIPSDQIVFTGEGGLLSFDANLKYDHPTGTLYVTNANVGSNLEVGGNATVSSLEEHSIIFAGTGGLLSTDGNLTYDASISTVAAINANLSGNIWISGDATISSIPADQIVFTAENGLLSFEPNLKYNKATETLFVTNANIHSNLEVGGNATVSSLTANSIVFAGEGGLLSSDGNLTYDAFTSTITTNNANVSYALSAGTVTVGNSYMLPAENGGSGQILATDGNFQTFWRPGPPEGGIVRKTFSHTIDSLLGYGSVNFNMSLGVSSIVYNLTVSRPVKVEVFATAARNENNPYTFIATPDHLIDDGTVVLNDGSSFQSRQYSIFANLDDPPGANVYVTITSIDQYLAATPVHFSVTYFPAVTDSRPSLDVLDALPLYGYIGKMVYLTTESKTYVWINTGWAPM